MSNAAAPNSLNVYKRVTIIRHEDDKVTFEDSSGTTKSLSVKDFRDVLSATQAPTISKQAKSDIPVPEINEVETYHKDIPATYDIKDSYIRYHHATEKDWKKRVDYVGDAEDEQWLNESSKFGEAARVKATGPVQLLSMESFEAMIDVLEKTTAFDSIVTVQQAENLILETIPELTHIFPVKTLRAQGNGSIQFKHMIQDVYNYWVSKRSKLKRPLLRRYWPVTSTDDTNPHLVFRPREKEKYKLRKKRQNDMEAFQKLNWLRHDFDNLRASLELVQRREELHRLHLQLQMERFQQRIHDVCDTSGTPREASLPSRSEVKRILDVPEHFDAQFGGRKAKRGRDPSTDNASSYSQLLQSSTGSASNRNVIFKSASQLAGPDRTNIAGRNHGEPAPNFLQPLESRESYVSSWQNAVPYVTAYENAEIVPATHFRHRPRIGRGGRICIDRVPQAPPPAGVKPVTVLRAGIPLPRTDASSSPKTLLDLLPRPIDTLQVKHHIEGLTMAALREEDVLTNQPASEDADADQVLVRMDDWLDTDEQLWGEEKYVVGPL